VPLVGSKIDEVGHDIACEFEMRLHSAIGYGTPADHLTGLTQEIDAERDRKLEEARMRQPARSRVSELAKACSCNDNRSA
jgi:hypothetical protein